MSNKIWMLSVLGLILPVLVLHGGRAMAEEKALRPVVGEPLQEARRLMQEQEFEAALAKIGEADAAVDEATPYERYIIGRMRGSAAAGLGDYPRALRAYLQVLESEELPEHERLPILDATARMAYTIERYDEAVELLRRYREAGGADRQTLGLLPQALYVTERYDEAARVLTEQVQTLEAAGDHPTERQLRLLASARLKSGDSRGYLAALRESVMRYPGEERWNELVAHTADLADVPQRLTLETYRVRWYTGTLSDAADYMEAAQLALQAGYPGEANAFLETGFETGVLGEGAPDRVERQHRLRRLVERRVAEDKGTLREGEEQAALEAGGDALVRTGFNHVAHGRHEKGLTLMRRGIAKGGLEHPEEVKLHYGYALLLAGKVDEAVEAFARVRGEGAVRELARLWVLAAHAGREGMDSR